MARIGMHEAKTNLSRLVERAEKGEEVVITRHGESAARLVSARESKGFTSLMGVWKGRVEIGEDFDDLPDDLAESLGMKP